MDEGRRKELEKLFIMDLDDAWRTRLSPEEALLIALWDRQFAEAQLRLQQGKNRKASQRASTKECRMRFFTRKKQGEDFVFFVLTEVLDGVIVLVY